MYKSFDQPGSDLAHAGIPSARFQERHIAYGELASEFASNSRWQHLDDPASLLKMVRQMKAGSVVLPYGRSTGFRSLAKLVAAIRQVDNSRVRIVVRESSKRLRLSQTTALLRLGVSTILPMSMNAASARQQVQALEGTRFMGTVRNDVERIIREARLLQMRQQLSVSEFQAHTRAVLGAVVQDLPHTLVVLHPMTLAGVEAITSRLAVGLRDGVYCSHPEGIWILLMACKPLDCQLVLERVLGQRFESLLVGWRKMGRPVDILFTIQEMSGADDEAELNLLREPQAA